MKKNIFIFTLLLLSSLLTKAQAIRKEFNEMTDSEKTELVAAFYQLRDLDNDGIEAPADTDPNDDDIINDLADFHLNNFSFDNAADPTIPDLHLNLPDEPTREIFLSWHRSMIFELEQYMQDINPNIGMPYWNSTQIAGYDNTTVTNTINSTLFNANFLGPFETDWAITRNVGLWTDALPAPGNYTNIFNQTDFFIFSDRLERRAPHNGAHRWVGGTMQSSASARDPIFYLHHTFVDKLWVEWVNLGNTSLYTKTSDMIRYDGTYTFHGVTKPNIAPNDIIDHKTFGTFYAENQLAELEDYTVSNTYNAQENFYYQYTIQSGNNFTIPNLTDCKFESVNEIVLTPGFLSETGSNFIAKIDTDNDISTSARSSVTESRKGVKNPFDENLNTQVIIFNQEDLNRMNDDVTIIKSFPNPFTDKIYINLSNEVENCKIEVINMMGKVIRTETYEDVINIELGGMYDLSNGVYVLRVYDSSKEKLLIAKRFIKL
jgi:tyrosinase